MDKADLQGKINRGDHADRILKDPLIQEAIKGMRDKVFQNIRTSHWKDVDEREELYKMLKVIDDFEHQFTDAINGGKKAKSRLTDLLKGDRNGS